MKRSLTEAEALLLKAARGAGVPAGHTDDFARAGRYLLATDPQAADQLLLALAGPHVPASLSDDGKTIAPACAVMAGPLALDLMICGASRIVLQDVDAPAVVRAMLALACAERGLLAQAVASGRDITLARCVAPAMPVFHGGHVKVPVAVWEGLETLAARTFVPATLASRLAGAGAGLTDND